MAGRIDVIGCCSQGGYMAHILDMGDNLFVGNLVANTASHFWTGND